MKSFLPFRHPHDQAILALAIPAVGSLAIDPLVSLVDTAFVGRLGTAELGALGINAAIFALTFLVFNFLAYGTTPQIGRAVGRGDNEAAGRITIQALTLGAAVGILATAALLLLTDPILSIMGADGPLYQPAATYLKIRALAGPTVLLMIASHGTFRGYQDTRTPFVVSAILNIINHFHKNTFKNKNH
jgi:MATE family multidrug resistance protein